MIPHANAAHFPQGRQRWVSVAVRAAAFSVLALVLSQYLAGFFFLWLSHLNTRSADPLTVARYAHYYGDRSDIRRRVWIASGLGVLMVALCALPIMFAGTMVNAIAPAAPRSPFEVCEL